MSEQSVRASSDELVVAFSLKANYRREKGVHDHCRSLEGQRGGERQERCQTGASHYPIGLVEASYIQRGCNNCHQEQESAGQPGSRIQSSLLGVDAPLGEVWVDGKHHQPAGCPARICATIAYG